jgi:glycine/D-amino acid oxidase-like deaminating enzyme/nitrite reductase/ring-hydroxylating ferredoxin subunit
MQYQSEHHFLIRISHQKITRMGNYNISGSDNKEGSITSGSNHSYWVDSVQPIAYTPVYQDMETETVIVGGGIAGLSVAYCLSKAGRRVIVVEDGLLGSGESGRTTAHLVNALDDRYYEIEKVLGKDTARLAAESHTAAINFVEEVVHNENIHCEFKRVEGYLFLHPSDKVSSLEDELVASRRAGIPTELIPNIPGMPSVKGPCLRFPNQATFHPMKYYKGLADCITRNGGQIFTESHATEIRKGGITVNGHTIKAEHVVVATNTPVNDLVTMHTKQFPYRTYVIGALIERNSLPDALWWDTGNLRSKWIVDPYHYVRIQRYDDQHDLLISGGEDHKTGQAENEDLPEEMRFHKLESWTRDHFPMIKEIVYQWSGQVLEPLDSLAFIGRNPGNKNTYIATGDSGNGMTHGTLAGILISDLIHGKQNPWEEIYKPSRITLKVAGDYIHEVGNMAAQYADWVRAGDLESIQELGVNQGAVITMGARKIAVFKDEGSTIHAYSAVCPHLGCILHWNSSEHSFDCPCHGSRFTCEGKVVNGPARGNLKKIDIKPE